MHSEQNGCFGQRIVIVMGPQEKGKQSGGPIVTMENIGPFLFSFEIFQTGTRKKYETFIVIPIGPGFVTIDSWTSEILRSIDKNKLDSLINALHDRVRNLPAGEIELQRTDKAGRKDRFITVQRKHQSDFITECHQFL